MKTTYTQPILYFIAFAILSACTVTTQITGSWKSKDLDGTQYKNIFIVALTHDVNARKIVENELAAQLRDQGIQVTTSMELYGPINRDQAGSKHDIATKVSNNGNDAIFTVSLVDAETETRYVPGDNNMYAPTLTYNYYGDFESYYNYYFPELHEPGYYANDKVYFLESNLYDVASEELMWSAQSQSYSPGDIENFAGEFAEVTVARLKRDKLIQ